MTWREYHEATGHSPASLRRSPHFLDWANQPDPYRHYEGAPHQELPADPPAPDISTLDLLNGASGSVTAVDGPALLSQILFYSAAISASKRIASTGGSYSLRVNPSSGNLHPTEFHFFTRGLAQWPDGLYHYLPASHCVEQRASGHFDAGPAGSSAPLVFVLTSIAWREAWKYRDRAYRYCLHDMGHAWQALALAARSIGCDCRATGEFADDEVARFCRFSPDEWPMLVIEITGNPMPLRAPDSAAPVWSSGRANQLSDQQVTYSSIEAIHAATKVRAGGSISQPLPGGSGEIRLPAPAAPVRPFGEVARTRRSALDFVGGARTLSLAQLSALLGVTARPFFAGFADPRLVQLYLYVHRVDGLPPGIYRHWADRAELEALRPGDERVAAAGLSLGQDLAGNACVAFSMIADLDRAARAYGDRGYRYAFFEAGAMGQRLYLAAEALGLRATGIGAFFDDEVNRYLQLAPEQGQVIYHFAIGYPVHDPRLEA